MQVIDGITVFGKHDDNTLAQIRDVSSRAVRTALMGDGHLGYVMPIGGVAAYRNQVSVAGVGFDIGCGNCAIRTDLKLMFADGERERAWMNNLADEIADTISFGIGRKNRDADAPTDHELFSDPAWDILPTKDGVRQRMLDKARSQLGTVGSGNHYVDVFVDEQGRVWVGVHFGSRGLGHGIASGAMSRSEGLGWGDRVKEVEGLVSLDSALGQEYWALMTLAQKYASVGREWVAQRVVDLLGAEGRDIVNVHHNFGFKETHFGEELVVVRKGATPAFPGQRCFVGGSMGDCAVILQGADPYKGRPVPITDEELDAHFASPDYAVNELQRAALFSTVHGAGRVMSRTAAAGKRNRRTGVQKSPGLVKQEDMSAWLERVGVVLRGGGLDESPQAYRRLPEVLAAQGPTIEVLHTLKPLVVVMAGADTDDPFRD